MPYSPLGRGFLTGQITSRDDLADDDFRKANPRFAGDAFEANMAVVRAVQAIAAEKGISAAKLALAWVLARGEDVVPIPGTRNADRLAENVGAVGVELSAADLDRIEAAAPVEPAPAEESGPYSQVHVSLMHVDEPTPPRPAVPGVPRRR